MHSWVLPCCQFFFLTLISTVWIAGTRFFNAKQKMCVLLLDFYSNSDMSNTRPMMWLEQVHGATLETMRVSPQPPQCRPGQCAQEEASALGLVEPSNNCSSLAPQLLIGQQQWPGCTGAPQGSAARPSPPHSNSRSPVIHPLSSSPGSPQAWRKWPAQPARCLISCARCLPHLHCIHIPQGPAARPSLPHIAPVEMYCFIVHSIFELGLYVILVLYCNYVSGH